MAQTTVDAIGLIAGAVVGVVFLLATLTEFFNNFGKRK